MRRIVVAALLAAAAASAAGCAPFVEQHADRSDATLRPHTDAFTVCLIDEATYRQVVAAWLRTRSGEAPPLRSLALGRAVALPWVSRHIADAALRLRDAVPKRRADRGTPRDALAAAAIRDPALLERLAAPFAGSSYRLDGVSFEKVLYGRADEHSSHRDAGAVLVPYDAQIWLRLAPRR